MQRTRSEYPAAPTKDEQIQFLNHVKNNNTDAVIRYIKTYPNFINVPFIGIDAELLAPDDSRPLHIAALTGHIDVVNILINAKANIDPLDKFKRSPLHIAALMGYLAIVNSLIEADADINLQSRSGLSPLQFSARNGHLAIVDRLIEAGADINLSDISGLSPLHIAVENGYLDIVRRLIEAGANVNLQNYLGQSPLHIACGYTSKPIYLDIIEKLLKANADVMLQDKNGRTATNIFLISGPPSPSFDMWKKRANTFEILTKACKRHPTYKKYINDFLEEQINLPNNHILITVIINNHYNPIEKKEATLLKYFSKNNNNKLIAFFIYYATKAIEYAPEENIFYASVLTKLIAKGNLSTNQILNLFDTPGTKVGLRDALYEIILSDKPSILRNRFYQPGAYFKPARLPAGRDEIIRRYGKELKNTAASSTTSTIVSAVTPSSINNAVTSSSTSNANSTDRPSAAPMSKMESAAAGESESKGETSTNLFSSILALPGSLFGNADVTKIPQSKNQVVVARGSVIDLHNSL